jgi:hypothetical protein
VTVSLEIPDFIVEKLQELGLSNRQIQIVVRDHFTQQSCLNLKDKVQLEIFEQYLEINRARWTEEIPQLAKTINYELDTVND